MWEGKMLRKTRREKCRTVRKPVAAAASFEAIVVVGVATDTADAGLDAAAAAAAAVVDAVVDAVADDQTVAGDDLDVDVEVDADAHTGPSS